MRILAYVPDLMDRSRLSVLGSAVSFVKQPEDLEGEAVDVVIADLGRPGALEALAAAEAGRKVGFVSHESTEVFEAGAAAGVEVMARSRFLTRVRDVILKT